MSKFTITKSNITIAVVLAAAIIVSTNWYWLKAYYNNLVYNDFKTGDKLYANQNMFGNSKVDAVILYRFVRTLNAKEIQSSKPLHSLQNEIQNNIQHLPDSCLIMCGKMYTRETLNNQKSAYLGLYINNKISKVWSDFSNKTFTLNMYAIQTKTNLLDSIKLSKYVKIPKGFTWANDTLYISPRDVNSKELPSFQQ